MCRGSLLLVPYGALLLLFLLPFICSQTSIPENNSDCTLSCGNIGISSPFRLKGDPQHCGNRKYELACEENVTILYFYNRKFYAKAINYNNFTIRFVDAAVQKKDNYYSIPRYSLTPSNFSYPNPYSNYLPRLTWSSNRPDASSSYTTWPIIFMDCPKPMHSPGLVETAPCVKDGTYSSNSSLSNGLRMFSYSILGWNGFISSLDLGESCEITQMLMVSPSLSVEDMHEHLTSCEGIYSEIAHGFELSWFDQACSTSNCTEYPCVLNKLSKIECLRYEEHWYNKILKPIDRVLYQIYLYIDSWFIPEDKWWNVYPYRRLIVVSSFLGLFQVVRFLFGFPCLIALIIYKCKRRHLSMYENIEDFLQNNQLMPVRYSYSDIKKMARGFKDKLGEGGFGSVYKAKLRSGRLVAIKMLGKSKANGQDFINEVDTIGRIHYVNVVQLIGFCVEGSKRALVYDFMPNGSLDKHIFSQQGVISLSCEKMFEISLGVARGIEYLHRGCDMQILHFDIKPHNILLDENFLPKVSDFGLARLCPLDNSIVSLTAARGTIGYMAPEFFYKNIGGVSYKADVYSFGMLLMEMAGKRKNLNANIEHLSQIYFPTWVFDQLSGGNDLTIGDATEEEKKIIKKMIIVALWCIQMKPSDRPSMNKVVEMLEGEIESLQMPPKPFLYPQQMPVVVTGGSSSTASAASRTTTTSREIVLIADENSQS
ncbi:LEAF RUST 10 DISEASE-RESISTANCE LOCUS RECEPTOR-LIKE PROTEIN KINASE-like 2.2 [Pyrus x bretschneideri]|uniref:LEAF RUST 10 DISEASE-RESISTANCE LOCUS RECEPTOR-LIKE PROTEIN KINASE-like 2.2 n=1 Tax=Pyrus x bretschneideri TaxID=225117 RepID=UPI00202F64ED|nr:LEAF RUST 10 DISEASE-RESISTANCE LOCUS RECEPTOR-LIKE PROTEIN KINASE-like 2.2 [Pyrus x bretschneideri]